VWVNNPTVEEIGLALAQGAVGCTTNPAYGANLLRRAPDQILPIIADCVRLSPDDAVVCEAVQLRLVQPIVERFRPLYNESGGREGFVSIQGAPEADTDAKHMVEEARAGHALGPNAAPKIPATRPGLSAFEVMVAEGCPTIVTEVFSLAQFIETCERYLRVSDRTGNRPPFFVSPITGIFGDHLKALAATEGLDIATEDIAVAGVALSRACYRVAQERRYPVVLLCGGARIPFDLTGLVGGALHATINWSTFTDLMTSSSPFVAGIAEPIDPAAIERLTAAFDDVRRGLVLDGLTVEEFENFGPVQHFRDVFIRGWRQIGEAIASERAALVRG
jgi:transaldolase